LAPRFALAFGRFAAVFAFGRFAAFLFFLTGFRFGAASLIGAGGGSGGGGGGYIGSIMPGPVQLLSEKSLGSSIGSSPPLVVRERGV
jgi:hypothetical protein